MRAGMKFEACGPLLKPVPCLGGRPIGAPLTFTAEQVAHIVAMACEQLDDSDGPVNQWTHAHLDAEAVEC